ncbi:MAG: type II toxin-antitoxin system RelE/ParE family toxin [Leptothrix sp. (in: b-proteobacteria)]
MTISEPPAQYKYRLLFMPEALEEWRALDGSVKENLKKLLAKRLDNPHMPGGELHGELAGCYKIKLNKQGIRLVYAVEDDKLIVMVMAVDKREDSIVYKSAMTRLAGKATVAGSKTKVRK